MVSLVNRTILIIIIVEDFHAFGFSFVRDISYVLRLDSERSFCSTLGLKSEVFRIIEGLWMRLVSGRSVPKMPRYSSQRCSFCLGHLTIWDIIEAYALDEIFILVMFLTRGIQLIIISFLRKMEGQILII